MRVATRQNKKTGEMNIEYANVAKQPAFRFCLLKNIIESIKTDITIFIDTNQSIANKPVAQIEAELQQLNIHYQSMLAESNPRSIFGLQISVNKQPMREHKIVLELPANMFSKELFETIRNYDIAFGFGKNKSFEDICDDFRISSTRVLFNKEYFQESMYDSIVCECLRSSLYVEPYLRETEYEMAL